MTDSEFPRPLLWNPLPRAADWLSKRTGKPIDVLALLDLLIQAKKHVYPAPHTIVEAPIPRSVRLAAVTMFGHPERDSLIEGFKHKSMTAEFGELPIGLAYVRHEWRDVTSLHVNQLVELCLHGHCELDYLGHPKVGQHIEHEGVWIMPFAQAAHAVKVDACGIKGDDLYWLGEQLAPNLPQIEQPQVPAAQVKPISRFEAQEAEILAAIREAGHEPLSIPERQPGKPGIKLQIRNRLVGKSKNFPKSGSQFDKAWIRLRASGKISD